MNFKIILLLLFFLGIVITLNENECSSYILIGKI